MKRKLTDYVFSRAKHLFQSEAGRFEQTAALVRRQSLQAAEGCAKIGRNNDVQFNKSLKEFLAFFCVLAVSELGLKLGKRSDAELREVYTKLIKAVCEGKEPDPALQNHQLTVSGLISYKRSGFDHWFYGYWNAELEGMRISKEDLKGLEERRLQGPTGNYSADAQLILLVRVARLENAKEILPSGAQLAGYDRVIREEVERFIKELKRIIG